MPEQSSVAPMAALWRLLLAARRAGAGLDDMAVATLSVDALGQVADGSRDDALATIEFAGGRWRIVACRADPALLDLYLPLCAAAPTRPLVVAHLGQSLDGQIATSTGDSNFVTGPANLDHLHRLRALCDAIVVGAGTIASDDPQLTTRRVEGSDPVRIVIDPNRRLRRSHRVFTDGGRSIVVYSARATDPAAEAAASAAGESDRSGSADIAELAVPATAAGIDLRALLEKLRDRGLASIFVEGGGRTVSAFVAAGLVDRLQIAVAPLLTGAGRAGLSLPARAAIGDCVRPPTRIFAMGDDVLFDCDLSGTVKPAGEDGALPRPIG